MRSKRLMVCGCVVTAVALLAMPAEAQSPVVYDSYECSSGEWAVETLGVGTVSCLKSDWDTYGFYSSGTGCTGIEYRLVSTTGENAALAYGVFKDVCATPEDPYAGCSKDFFKGGYVQTAFAPCAGDGKLGVGMCHEQLLKMTPYSDANNLFRIVVEGNYSTTWSSLVLKLGNKYETCRVPGIGSDSSLLTGACVPSCGNFDDKQTILKTEILNFDGCFLKFEFNLSTGAVVYANLLEDQSDPACRFQEFGVEELVLEVLDTDTGVKTPLYGQFGDGYVSVGLESCSCRVIGGRVYCWGTNCPS